MSSPNVMIERFADVESGASEVLNVKYVVDIVESVGPAAIEWVAVYRIPMPNLTLWAARAETLLLDSFGARHPYVEQFRSLRNKPGIDWEEEFLNLVAIFLAASDDFGKGYHLQMRPLLLAEVLKDFLDQAVELLDKGFVIPACTLAGATLENFLREQCESLGLEIGKKRGIQHFNGQLKDRGVYSNQQSELISVWAQMRNVTAHGNPAIPSNAEVRLMIQGIRVLQEESATRYGSS